MKATHKISACYFPVGNEVEITIENLESGKQVFLTTKVIEEIGLQLTKVIDPCVYYRAVSQDKIEAGRRRINSNGYKKLCIEEIIRQWLKDHGYDGLYNIELGCSCDLDNLFPCVDPDLTECFSGVKKGSGYNCVIGPKGGDENVS